MLRKDMKMKNELRISLASMNENVRLHASAPQRNPIVVDYFPPEDDTDGYTSLELLLISAASCLATALKLVIQKRLKKHISRIEVDASGVRRTAHPTGFSKMSFHVRCVSRDLDEATLNELAQSTKQNICPVFAMLRDDIETSVSATVIAPSNQDE